VLKTGEIGFEDFSALRNLYKQGLDPSPSYLEQLAEASNGLSEKQHVRVTFEQFHAFSLFALGVDEAEKRVFCTI
jgi:hypothetical protein